MTYEQVLMYKKAAKEAEESEKQKAKKPVKQKPKKTGYRRTGKQYSQLLGPLTSTIGTTIGGSIIGGIAGGPEGAAIGGTIGLYGGSAANAVAYLVGALRRARTAKQQAQVDNKAGRTALHYAVPGMAAYDKAARTQSNKAQLAQQAQNA